MLDRVTGKTIVTTTFAKANWAKGLDAKGQLIPNPAKMPQLDGALVSPNQAGAANWPPPSFSPSTGLLYVNATDAYSVYYITTMTKSRKAGPGTIVEAGLSRRCERSTTRPEKSNGAKWSHTWEGTGGPRSGVLSTAGNLVFAGDPSNALVAVNAATGQLLWHANLGTDMSNAPITYELDGTQYLMVGAGDTLLGFAMLSK